MYTNVLAALACDRVGELRCANFPNGLESIVDLGRLRLVGYLRGMRLLAMMAASEAVLMATLAECQPMTQLEAHAVGRPALTGPLGLEEFAGDELTRLTEVGRLDNPPLIAAALARLLDAAAADPAAITAMIDDHLVRRHALAAERYADFLELV